MGGWEVRIPKVELKNAECSFHGFFQDIDCIVKAFKHASFPNFKQNFQGSDFSRNTQHALSLCCS